MDEPLWIGWSEPEGSALCTALREHGLAPTLLESADHIVEAIHEHVLNDGSAGLLLLNEHISGGQRLLERLQAEGLRPGVILRPLAKSGTDALSLLEQGVEEVLSTRATLSDICQRVETLHQQRSQLTALHNKAGTSHQEQREEPIERREIGPFKIAKQGSCLSLEMGAVCNELELEVLREELIERMGQGMRHLMVTILDQQCPARLLGFILRLAELLHQEGGSCLLSKAPESVRAFLRISGGAERYQLDLGEPL